MRSLPKVVSNIPNDLRSFVDRVREYIANAGDESFVTKGDLLRGGIIAQTPGGTIIPPGSTAIDNPTVPTGLTASGALANIILSWDAPNYAGHLETRVWAATTNDFSAKVLVGASPGTTFAHNIGGGASRYYWIQHVNINLVEGPFNSNTGVLGTTGTDPAYVLDVLAGSISETELAAELNGRIDLIDGSAATPGTIPYQLSLLQGQIDELAATPTYDNATTYAAGDIVQYSGGLYQATTTTTGNLPTDTAYWLKIGDYTSLGDAVATHTTQIANLTTDLGAEVTARQALATQMRGSYAGTDLSLVTSGLIYEERQARSTAISSEVSARETLAAQLRGDYTGTDLSLVTAGLIYSERTARAGADSSLASDISTLSTTVGNQATSLQTLSQSVDGVKGLYTVKVDNNGYVSGFGLESVLDNATIPLWAASTYYAVGAVRRVSGVTTKVMRCTVAGTSGTSTPTLSGAVGTTFTDGGVTWQIASSTATSTFIANVDQFAVLAPTASIPTRANTTSYSVGSIAKVASSTSKMLVCRVAGTSGSSAPDISAATIGSMVTDGTVEWQVASVAPVIVVSTTTTIGGVTYGPGVYIDGASIVNATINNAQIADLAVDNAKIADLSVVKLTAGALQVGSYIQSTTYVSGSSGWKINADGTAEFANAVVRGNIYGSGATSYGAGEGLFSGRDNLVVTSLTRSSTTATMTTSQAHGLAVGSVIVVSGTTNGWDNTYTVTSVPSTTQVRFTVSASLPTTATGTIRAYTPYRFRLGTPGGNQVTWNGATLAITGTLTSSTINSSTINSSTIISAIVRSANATAALTGAGFYISDSVFRIGDPTSKYLYWDGSDLTINGQVIGADSVIPSEINRASDVVSAGITSATAVPTTRLADIAQGTSVVVFSVQITPSVSLSSATGTFAAVNMSLLFDRSSDSADRGIITVTRKWGSNSYELPYHPIYTINAGYMSTTQFVLDDFSDRAISPIAAGTVVTYEVKIYASASRSYLMGYQAYVDLKQR